MSPSGGSGRMVSRSTPSSTAFVMPGGATRGASQVGMLLALTERAITPDFVVGTSIGAMNASSYLADMSVEGINRLAELWTIARRSQIFPLTPRTIAEKVREHRGYLLPNDGLRDWIDSNLRHGRLEDFDIPLYVVATEVETGEPVVMSRGDALTSLLASSAIPGLFPPVAVDGQQLCDGGVAADVPLPQAVALGASTVYVLSTTATGSPGTTAWTLLDRVFGRPTVVESMPAYPGVTVHWLPAPSFDGNPFSFRASRRLIDEAYALASDYLDGQRLGGGRPEPTLDLTGPRPRSRPAPATRVDSRPGV